LVEGLSLICPSRQQDAAVPRLTRAPAEEELYQKNGGEGSQNNAEGADSGADVDSDVDTVIYEEQNLAGRQEPECWEG
jgi:hypothetical protein